MEGIPQNGDEDKIQARAAFVLDAEAAGIIMKHKIKTYIIGSNMKNLDNFLNNKKFRGTRIEG